MPERAPVDEIRYQDGDVVLNEFPGVPSQQPQVNDAYWNLVYNARAHEAMWHREFPSAELVATVIALGLETPCNVVDLGCGAGSEALFLAQCGLNVSAVDVSASALESAQQRVARHGVSVRFFNADVLDLPFDDASVDFANDRACFHHIQVEDRACYVDEIARVLKPSGHLLLRVCDPAASSQSGTTPESVCALFDSQRFSIRGIKPFAFDAVSRWLPAMLVLVQRTS